MIDFIIILVPNKVKQNVAKAFLFTDNEINPITNNNYQYIQLLCLFLLPIYFIGTSFYVFVFGLSIGSKATNLWLLGNFIAYFQDIFLLQPLRIWLRWIVISSSADHIRVWHGLLRNRKSCVR